MSLCTSVKGSVSSIVPLQNSIIFDSFFTGIPLTQVLLRKASPL